MQQIDLYRLRTHRAGSAFLLHHAVWIVSAVLAILLCWTAWGGGSYWMARRDLDHLMFERDKQAKNLNYLQQNLPSAYMRDTLEKQYKALKRDIALQVSILHFFENRQGDATGKSFASMLEGLSRRWPEGIWLQRFAFQAYGTQVRLEGQTVDATLVPDMLHHLKQEAVFRGVQFKDFRISRDAHSRYLNFSMQSQDDDAAGQVP